MQTVSKRRVALKGQSRSKFCADPIRKGSKSLCARLAGHNGRHRTTTMRAKVAPVASPIVTTIPEAESKRLVAAPAKRAKRARGAHKSDRPSARLA